MTFELKATVGEENDLVINDCLCKALINMTENKKSAVFKYAQFQSSVTLNLFLFSASA